MRCEPITWLFTSMEFAYISYKMTIVNITISASFSFDDLLTEGLTGRLVGPNPRPHTAWAFDQARRDAPAQSLTVPPIKLLALTRKLVSLNPAGVPTPIGDSLCSRCGNADLGY
jgi:hypothetical protein